ncbi:MULTISPECIES: hypothetical protein [unclassified Mesorhizobium]|uniref:hypothetical protein n=1 Tax=unclassified Mesorhizobium TaxID=325217 RepID=UPI000FCA813C|nr:MULTISPECIES: hypothetical protein [unclassified Mesorhizobium]RUX93794.1 hypothetical protein EN993_18060 [Mesorhizobium sp. M7D.F.Ca.US.004.01.2.1]RVA34873.1 hypothetical protein EN935_05520 [Mesorhizobium sp. M7D.F.Ca.US.004.03.1.1]
MIPGIGAAIGGLGGSASGGGGSAIYAFLSTQADTAAASTTFILSFGTVGYARRVFLGFAVGGASTNITSVVNNSVGATRITDGPGSTAGRQGLYYSDVPAGVAATFVITTSAACTTCVGSAYETTTANMVLLDVLANFDSGTTSMALSDLAVAAGGFVLAHARAGATDTLGLTYSGIDTPTQDDLTTSGFLKVLSKSFLTTENADTNDVAATLALSNAVWGLAASFFVHVGGMLNPADKAGPISLSNINLTATALSAGSSTVKTTNSYSGSEKLYFEWTVNSSGSFFGAGFGNSSAVLASLLGIDANGIAIYNDGNVYKNGSSAGSIGALTIGNIVPIAIDRGANLFWCRKGAGNWNNNGSADPATGVGGIALPTGMTSGSFFAGLSLSGAGDQGTVNLGASAFNQTPPSGFSAWG